MTHWEEVMGDVIRTFRCRSAADEKERRLRVYFDTGSPRTFVRRSVALRMKDVARLSKPARFSGLGNGFFRATHMIRLEIQLSGLWVPHLCYVVADEVLDPGYDVLLGHDFMQVYDIQVNPRRRSVSIKRESLRMALRVRR